MTVAEEQSNMTKRSPTASDLLDNYDLLDSDPHKFLQMANAVVSSNPQDRHGYLGRHRVWDALGRRDLALADLDKALSLKDSHMTRQSRAELLRRLGRHPEAIDEFNRAESMSPELWPTGFGPLFRAHSHAILGNLQAALADCATLPDDHWTPDLDGAPGGTKPEIADKLRRLAIAVQQGQAARG
jgi:tetratricopeptide (TPR) repeat protein